MKTVFKSSEIAHVWAHKGAPHGRCPGNGSFNGDVFYSYKTAIAQFVSGKGGKIGVVLDRTSHSSSTANTQSQVWRAVSHIEDQFTITGNRRGTSRLPSGAELRDNYISRAEEALEPRTRWVHGQGEVEIKEKASTKAIRVQRHIELLREAVRACEFFGLPTKAIQKRIDSINPDEYLKVITEDQEKRAKAKAKADAKKLAGILSRIKSWLFDETTTDLCFFSQSLPPELEDQIAEKNERITKALAASWKSGETRYTTYRGPILLRREGDEIVTTQGARFPVEHARKAFAFVKKCVEKGEAFHCNGRSIHVGHYNIDAIDADGTVRAGCHVIQYAELLDLEKRGGFLTASETYAKSSSSDLSLPGVVNQA